MNDGEEAFRLAMDGRLAITWTAMPCIVTSVNLAKMTIECQPALKAEIITEAGTSQTVNLPKLVDVPIVFPSAGGFTLTLPIKPGDEVLVVFSSRCIDSWWQSGGIQEVAEGRMHDLSDGFAIPGPRSIPNALTGISSTGAQLRNEAGTTYVEISADGKIKLVSPSEIDITGNLKVTGNIVATGEVTGGLVPVTLTTHTHTGVTSGGSNTGGPVG